MSIQIDRSLFLPKVATYAQKKGYGGWIKNVNELADETITLAQDWFDWEPWKKQGGFTSQIEYRIKLKEYVKDNLSLSDSDKSWFIPTFLWIWLAERVISYIIKLIIEHYWPDLVKGTDIDVL